ncbi:hypothetical protein BSKO_11799 [Bryopsis sp. KO-2023]|nr:hypothetical protein BSKO_11799 [Bryopsis sp. KO-2023]
MDYGLHQTLFSKTASTMDFTPFNVSLFAPKQIVKGLLHPCWAALSIIRLAQMVNSSSSRFPINVETENVVSPSKDGSALTSPATPFRTFLFASPPRESGSSSRSAKIQSGHLPPKSEMLVSAQGSESKRPPCLSIGSVCAGRCTIFNTLNCDDAGNDYWRGNG